MRRHAKASFAGSTQGSGTRRGLFGLVCLCVLDRAGSALRGLPAAFAGRGVSFEGKGSSAPAAARLSLALAGAVFASLLLASPAFAAAPVINSASATNIGSSSAVISADISDGGTATNAHVTYGTTPGFGSTTPDAAVGGGNTLIPLTGLSPHTQYFFQVVADNGDGSDTSALQDFTTYDTPGPFSLPDNRAFEQVSPQYKNGNDVQVADIFSALSGNGASFTSYGGFADSASNGLGNFYVSHRGSTQWTTEAVAAPIPPTNGVIAAAFPSGYSSELDQVISQVLTTAAFPDPPHPLILRDSSGVFHDVSPGVSPGSEPKFQGGTGDFSHIIFTSKESLCCSAPNGVSNVYDFTGGQLQLVSIDTGGSPETGGATVETHCSSPGPCDNDVPPPHAISADGSRIFWRTPAGSNVSTTEIYMRQSLSSTVQVSASQRAPIDPNGPSAKVLWAATPDGRFAFFTSAEELTDDANTGPADNGNDLYRYDIETGTLVDLTVDNVDANGAQVLGVLGASDDGNRVYFAARGVLAAGAVAGDTNLYVRDGNTTTFVAKLAAGNADDSNWNLDNTSSNPLDAKSSEVTPSGEALLFSSKAPQLGYDNAGHIEFYRYDLGSGQGSCVSCNPTGTPATGDAGLTVLSVGADLSVQIPTSGIYDRNNLSNDGSRAFFTSPEKLVAGDTNNKPDVYEWAGGQLHLISTGTNADSSSFGAADQSGNNAFFVTRQRLTLSDQDTEVDLYDARVGGGFPEQPPLPPCQGDQCLGPAAGAPDTPEAASAGFAGKGNVSSEQNCNKLGREAKKLSNRAKRLRKNGKQAKRNGKSAIARKRSKKATRLAKRARNKSKSAKKCRKRNRGASK